MKKLKSLTALILAFSFLTPLGLTFAKKDISLPPQNTPSLDADVALPEIPPITEEPEIPETPPIEETPEAPLPPQIEYAQYINCTGAGVNIRSGAGTEFATVGVAEKGTSYAVLGKVGNWYKTFYRGKEAYISASFAVAFSIEESENEEVEKVLDEGYKHIGVPYVYGAVRFHDGKGKLLAGFTAQKFDCSSLVQYIFYKGASELLQVTTRTQVVQGKYVAKSDLQRGDCIYFTNESRKHLKGVERIGHVAVYLGDNYILHTASDYARIEKISTTRWKYYVEARRFV